MEQVLIVRCNKLPVKRGEFAPRWPVPLMAPTICGPSVWNSLHVTRLAPRILRFLENSWLHVFKVDWSLNAYGTYDENQVAVQFN